jgi:hypothetical protein
MVETHLRTGHDVVMPQLVTAPDEIEGFETAVHRSGAEYREVVLLAEKQQALDRFACRAASGEPITVISTRSSRAAAARHC